MKSVTLSIERGQVYAEVAKTTGYCGAKLQDIGDGVAAGKGESRAYYDIIPTVDEDERMLQRFWHEAAAMATARVKQFVVSVDDSTDYVAQLSLPTSYDDALTPSATSINPHLSINPHFRSGLLLFCSNIW